MMKVVGLVAFALGFVGLFVIAVARARRVRQRQRLISHIRTHAPRHTVRGQLYYELTEDQARALGFVDDHSKEN